MEQAIKLNINSCGNLFCVCGIEYNFVRFDSSTEKAYQINDGLGDTLQDRRSLQRAVLNQRGIGNGFNGKLKADDTLNWFVWLAVCGWILNLNIVGLMILQQHKQKRIKLIIG